MKFLNKAKKGMVLIMTTVILFIATSTVAVLSTFVLVARSQKVEYEYISRNKIALKNISFEFYNKILLPDICKTYENFAPSFSLKGDPVVYKTFEMEEIQSAENNIAYDYSIKVDLLPVAHSIFDGEYQAGYFQYQISSHYLSDFSSEEIREMTLTTIVNFEVAKNFAPGDTYYGNPELYTIGEMRFS